MPIFISHPTSRRDVAEHLARYLEQRGQTAWYAPRDIRPGEQWPHAIADAIKRSSAVVLLFCADADRSVDILRELTLASDANVPVYWLRMESVEPQRLGYFLRSTQWIDWLDQRDAALESLLQDLESGSPRDPQVNTDSTTRQSEPKILDGWPLGIAALENESHAAEAVAHVILTEAATHEDGSILVPTGKASTGVFRALVRVAAEYGDRPFRESVIINDTETFGVAPTHRTSRSRYVRETLIDPLGDLITPDAVQLLEGAYGERDPLDLANETLRRNPPILHVCSISPTGEFLGYEVGTYSDIDQIRHDRPRVIELSSQGRDYIDPGQPSRSVVTVGLGTALGARRLVLFVQDRSKVRVLKQMLTHRESPGIPASLLRLHESTVIVTTRAIAEAVGAGDMAATYGDAREAARWIVSL